MKAMRTHSRARSTTKAIGVAVASYANLETGLAFPGNDDLMSWGWGERTIQDSLRQLEALGELERVPEVEDARRPRVYRLPLAAQISLLDTGGAMVSAGAAPAPATRIAGAALTHAREGTLLTQEPNTPPAPPAKAVGNAVLTDPVDGSMPRAPLSNGVARTRRRRARRRLRELPPTPPGPCPLRAMTADSAAELIAEWQRLSEPLRSLLGESMFGLWIAEAHPHALGERIEVGYPSTAAAYAQQRYGPIVERTLGVPIAFVPCTGAAGLFASTVSGEASA